MTPEVPANSFVTSRPIAVLMAFIAAVVFGYFSYQRLAITLMPELSYPTVTVRTEYPGAAPEEVEKDVSRLIEEALGVIGGLQRQSSVSRAGVSDVILEFAWDTEMSDAVQEVLEKLDLVELPEDADRSLILRFDPELDPVMELSLISARPRARSEDELRRVRRIAELQLKRALEPIKGVAAVRVRGGLEEEIHVSLDADRLTRTQLSIGTVIDRLIEENINVAGGTVKEGRTDYMVRTLNEYIAPQEIADTVISVQSDRIPSRRPQPIESTSGALPAGISSMGGRSVPSSATSGPPGDVREIRIRDLGTVARSHKEREIITRTDGSESVQIDIFKEADANMVALSKRVRAVLGTLSSQPDAGNGERDPETRDDDANAGQPDKRSSRRPDGLADELFRSESVRVSVVADRSLFIERSIAEVRNTAIFGGFLAVLVLFLFLENVRSTLIIALSIPISLLVTFAPLNALGVSLNIMSLGGLALGIGMLVDSSIVVLESIYRCREEGDDVLRATVRGTQDVQGAVVASILTTIGVFLPMVFVEGVAGQAFGDLGLAVVFSLIASLFVALFFIPMLASRRGLDGIDRLRDPNRSTAGRIRLFEFIAWRQLRADLAALHVALRILLMPYLLLRFAIGTLLEVFGKLILLAIAAPLWVFWRGVLPVLTAVLRALWWAPLKATSWLLQVSNRIYPRILGWALDHSITVIVIMGGCLALMFTTATRLSSELLPEVHQGEFTIELALPVGTPLEETESILAPIERAILKESSDIESLIVTLGYDASNAQRSDEGEHTARFKILLRASADNAALEQQVAGHLRKRFANIPDLDARLVRPVLFSFRTPVEVEVYGDDLRKLRAMAERVRREMAAMPELTDVETTLRPGAPEVQIVYDRDQLRRYGLNVSEVARRVRDEVKGREATRLNVKERRIPIVVRLEERDRQSVSDLQQLIVDPEGTGAIRLSSVADVGLGEGPSEVRRVDSHRVAIVRANLARDTSLGSAVDAIEDRMRTRIEFPSDMSFQVSGQRQEWERSRTSLLLALALSVFLVYVIMAAQFESLVYPLIIMFSIPLAFFGTFVTLYALGVHLSIVVFLGMIMLAGIVVNNAIVLVDYINILKARGLSLRDAVVRAGSVRLRPILMTTATTILGLLPMALGVGDGAELRTPLALTVIGGLFASTALTLIVIPTLYALTDRALGFLGFGPPTPTDATANKTDEESAT